MALTAYRSDFADYIYASPTGLVEDGMPVVRYLQDEATFHGLEAELSLPGLEVAGGRIATRLVADFVRARLDDGGHLPQIPPLRAGAELRYTRNAWSAGISAHRFDGQDRVAANESPTAGYTMLGADASWRLAGFSRGLLLYLRGDNLLDADARRHTSPLKEFAPLPGRSLGAGVRLEF